MTAERVAELQAKADKEAERIVEVTGCDRGPLKETISRRLFVWWRDGRDEARAVEAHARKGEGGE